MATARQEAPEGACDDAAAPRQGDEAPSTGETMPLMKTLSSVGPRRIALVLFDAFETLVTPRIAPHLQYAEEARRHGLGQYLVDDGPVRGGGEEGGVSKAAALPVKDAFKSSFKALAKQHPVYGLHTGLSSSDEWWTMLIEQTMLKSGVPSDILAPCMPQLGPALLRRFASSEAYELVPGVMQMLQQLEALNVGNDEDVALSMATNSDHRILAACKDLGMDSFLDLDMTYDASRPPTEVDGKTVSTTQQPDSSSPPHRSAVQGPTLSYDVGYEKPDKRFFHAAVLRAFPKHGARQENPLSMEEMCRRTLYVGDSYEEDYVGARTAGLQSVWLQRGQSHDLVRRKSPGNMADNEITAISDLADVVSIVRQSRQAQ